MSREIFEVWEQHSDSASNTLAHPISRGRAPDERTDNLRFAKPPRMTQRLSECSKSAAGGMQHGT